MRGRRASIRARSHSSTDPREGGTDVVQYLEVWNSNDPETTYREIGIALGVADDLLGKLMMPAVYLDDEPMSLAIKVGKIRPDGYLPPEFKAIALSAANPLPKLGFASAHFVAKAAGTDGGRVASIGTGSPSNHA